MKLFYILGILFVLACAAVGFVLTGGLDGGSGTTVTQPASPSTPSNSDDSLFKNLK